MPETPKPAAPTNPVVDLAQKAERDPRVKAALLAAIAKGQARATDAKKGP